MRLSSLALPAAACLMLMCGPAAAQAPSKTAPPSAAPGAPALSPAAPKGAEAQALKQKAAGEVKPNTCADCHSVLGGEMETIVNQFKSSVHSDQGFTCADCHGGDPSSADMTVAMSPQKGFKGKPQRKDIPALCARCHADPLFMKQYGNLRTDQLSLYKISAHGVALFTKGDTKVAVCTDCHTVHGILAPGNPKASIYKTNVPGTCARCHADAKLMAQYSIDATVPEQYVTGRHGVLLLKENELSAPACNDCHGNHGALPPGVASIEHVCGQCHLQNEQYFSGSRHAAGFASLGLPRCLVCHREHKLQQPTDALTDETQDTYCGGCHAEGTPERAKVEQMRQALTSLAAMHGDAASLAARTEATTHISMAPMTPQVDELNTQLMTARVLVHTADPARMQAPLSAAQAEYKQVKDFTLRLLRRAAFNRFMVALLAALLFAYGIFMLFYKKYVLDRTIPWQYYEGPEEGVRD